MIIPRATRITAADLPGIFTYAQEQFNLMLKEFRRYGLTTEENLELRQGSGMLCYFDQEDGCIHLSLPNPEEISDTVKLVFMRSLLSCPNNHEFTRFMYLFVPRILAHEMGHYYRHHYRKFSQNLWHEEQVANQLANAVTKHRIVPADKVFMLEFIERAIEKLASRMENQGIAVDSYYSQLHALNISGALQTSTMEKIIMMDKLFSVEPMDMLKESGNLDPETITRLEKRQSVIEAFDPDYASDMMTYFYYQLGWLKLDLESREQHYVEEFARNHLSRSTPLLPIYNNQEHHNPNEHQIMALFKAHQKLAPVSETASRYFYKRYRSALLELLQSIELPNRLHATILRKEANNLLAHWDEETDALSFLMQLAPKSLKELFPQNIAVTVLALKDLEPHLTFPTDRNIWNYYVNNDKYPATINTLQRMEMMEHIDLFRSLPAEIMLELLHNIFSIKLFPGETIIWQGTNNNDIFILIRGKLDVLVSTDSGQTTKVNTIVSRAEQQTLNEVFGEMSFFMREPRTATIRASEASECLVIKASELEILAFKYPKVLMQMGKVLAFRLKHMSQELHRLTALQRDLQ